MDGVLLNRVWTTPCSVPLNGPLLQASVTVQPSNGTRSQPRRSPDRRRAAWGLRLNSLHCMPERARSIFLFRISFCIFLQRTFRTRRDARFNIPYDSIARCDKLTLRFCIRCGFNTNNVLESSHSRHPIKDHEKADFSLGHSDLVRSMASTRSVYRSSDLNPSIQNDLKFEEFSQNTCANEICVPVKNTLHVVRKFRRLTPLLRRSSLAFQQVLGRVTKVNKHCQVQRFA